MASVGDVTVALNGDASGAMSALGQVSNALAQIGELAAGLAIADAFIAGIQAATNALEGMLSAIEQVSAGIESFTVTTGVLFANAGAGMQQAGSGAQSAAASTGAAANTIAMANQRMADATQNYDEQVQKAHQDETQAIADYQAKLADLLSTYNSTMTAMVDAHQQAMDKIAQSESDATANYNRELTDRTQAYQDSLTALIQSHQNTLDNLQANYQTAIANINAQIDKLTSNFEAAAQKQQDAFATALDQAPDSYEAQRSKAASTMKSLQADLVQAQASGDGALVAALERRISEEKALQNESYSTYLANLQASQAKQTQTTQNAYNTQKAALDQKLNDETTTYNRKVAQEDATFAQRTATLNAQYQRDLANYKSALDRQMRDLGEQMTQQNAAYQKAVEDKNVTYQKDVANAKAAEAQKLQAVVDRLAQEKQAYDRAVRDAQESAARAGVGGGGSGIKASATLARQTPYASELPEQLKQLQAMVGGQNLTGEQSAGVLNSWLMQKTFGTPFTANDLRGMSGELSGYNLSTLKWTDTITNAAAGMKGFMPQMTPQYLAQLLGQVSTGQGGFAIRELAHAGLSLQELLPKGSFTSTGQLAVPASEVLPQIQAILDQRYKGMSARQAKTAPGLVSNFQDVGLDIAGLAGGTLLPGQVTGKNLMPPPPQGVGVYAEIEKELGKIYDWFSKNQDAVAKFGAAVGGVLLTAFKDLEPTIEKVAGGLEAWLSSGQAETDIAAFGAKLEGVVKGIANFAGSIASTVARIVAMRDAFMVAGVAMLGAFVLLNPFILVIAGLGAAVVALYQAWTSNWGGIRTTTESTLASMGTTWTDAWTRAQGPISALLPALERLGAVLTPLGELLAGVAAVVISAFVNGLGAALPSVVAAVVDSVNLIADTLQFLEDFVTGTVQVISDILQGNWGKAWTDSQAKVQIFVRDVEVLFDDLARFLQDSITATLGFIEGAFQIFNVAMNGQLLPTTLKIFSTAFDLIRKAIIDAIDSAVLFIVDGFNTVLSALQSLVDSVIAMINKVVGGALGAYNMIASATGGKPLNWSPIQDVNLGQIDTGQITAQLNNAANAAIVWTGNVIVQGSVMTEQNLVQAVRNGLIQTGRRNGNVFGQY